MKGKGFIKIDTPKKKTVKIFISSKFAHCMTADLQKRDSFTSIFKNYGLFKN